MSRGSKILGIILFTVIFIFVIYTLNNKINDLEDKYAVLNNQHTKLIEEHNQLIQDKQELEEQFNTLSNDFKNLTDNYNSKILENKAKDQEINSLTNNYNSVLENYQTLNDEVGVFKTRIEESMDWFKGNSSLNGLSNERRIKSSLRKCVNCEGDLCYIKTACIHVINQEELNLKYALDTQTSGKEDKLQTLEQFLLQKKGDCEDFSLFFAAELRYLIDYVNSLDKIPIIEAIIESNTSRNYDIVDRWYYPGGIEKKMISKNYIYPYVACGNIFDPNTQEIGGHCLIMLSKEQIKESQDIENLNDIELIESQNGLYIGRARNYGIFQTSNSENQVSQIITNNDYYMHNSVLYRNNTESHWYSYGYYYNKILELEN